MFRYFLISLSLVALITGCTRKSETQSGAKPHQSTGLGTSDQTGNGYSVDSDAAKKLERSIKDPTPKDRTRADQTTSKEKAQP
jgi:hypothetical protein